MRAVTERKTAAGIVRLTGLECSVAWCGEGHRLTYKLTAPQRNQRPTGTNQTILATQPARDKTPHQTAPDPESSPPREPSSESETFWGR
jgi:hypothetical protein